MGERRDVGVYQLRCVRNGWIYIGGSVRSISNRWSCHRATLRKGTHGNKKLQSDWRKYGESAFKLEVLEVCGKKAVRKREQFYLDRHYGRKCYNRHPNATSPVGFRLGEEGHEQRSQSAKNRCTTEWRSAVSNRVCEQSAKGNFGAATWKQERSVVVRHGDNHPFYGKKGIAHPCYGRKSTPEQLERYRAAALERERKRRTGELPSRSGSNHPFYGKTGTAHPCYGRKSTPEQRERYRQAALKREAEKRKERNRR